MTKRILVIDDDPTLLKLVQSVLNSYGFDVVAVNDAPNGLEMAMKQTPDLIVLDVMMPIINGFNICRLLKSQKAIKHIPIILLTSRATQADQEIGSEVGADAYVSKPFKTEELLGKVRELLKVP